MSTSFYNKEPSMVTTDKNMWSKSRSQIHQIPSSKHWFAERIQEKASQCLKRVRIGGCSLRSSRFLSFSRRGDRTSERTKERS